MDIMGKVRKCCYTAALLFTKQSSESTDHEASDTDAQSLQ